MLRVSKLLLVGGLLALLTACGGTTPTATVPAPTATTAAPPTNTVAPAATVAATVAATSTKAPAPSASAAASPTAAATKAAASPSAAASAAGAGSVVDETGKCRLTVAPEFKPDSSKDTWATADDAALLIVAGTDTPGLGLDQATAAFITGFQSVVTGYVETGRQTTKEPRGDVQIVTFSGAISGQDAKGIFFFVQKNSVLCTLVAIAVPPDGEKYATAIDQTAKTLEVVSGGTGSSAAPVAPTRAASAPPVAPTTAPVPVAPSVAPSAAPSAAPAGGSNQVATVNGKCSMTLPANFQKGSTDDNYETADNLAIVTIGGEDMAGLSFDEAVSLYVDTFGGFIDDYQETGRQKTPIAGGQKETVTYSGSLIGQPIKGVLYFYQGGTTLCTLSAVTLPPGDTQYQADIETMVATLQPAKP